MEITQRPFGVTSEGESVKCWRLTGEDGSWAEMLDYGCTLRSVMVPDRAGDLKDVVLGYDTLAEYQRGDGYLGATVGRVANRIGGASFTLSGEAHALFRNDGENHIHGGSRGFDRYLWHAEAEDGGLRFSRVSPDGEEGYPGELQVSVLVRWSAGAGLELLYQARSSRDTLLNLTNHAYFNLNGGGDILRHRLRMAADAYTETDRHCLPTGRILPVAGTAMDFRQEKELGQDLESRETCVRQVGGYDSNFVLRGEDPAAELYAPESGIRMRVTTDRPGIQLYTANFLTKRTGKGGAPYGPRSGVCLETGCFPDAVHHPDFPSCVLPAGVEFTSRTAYVFSADNP